MSTIEAARDAQRRAQELAARRDAEVAALADAGESYAQIAARLGVTRQRVGQVCESSQREEREMSDGIRPDGGTVDENKAADDGWPQVIGVRTPPQPVPVREALREDMARTFAVAYVDAGGYENGVNRLGIEHEPLLRSIDALLSGPLAGVLAERDALAAALDRVRALCDEAEAKSPDDFRTGQDHLTRAFREVNYYAAFMWLAGLMTRVEAALDTPEGEQCCCDRTTARLVICPVHPERSHPALLAAIEARRADTEFMTRIKASVEQYRPILDRLAEDDASLTPDADTPEGER